MIESWGKEKWGGATSVWYMYSKVAARRIAAFIIMRRNPIGMVHSHHYEILYNANQDVASFDQALSLDAMRKRGGKLPKEFFIRDNLYYRDVGKLVRQICRLLDVFERGRDHFIVYDGFKRHPARSFAETLQSLGVDACFEPGLSVHRLHRAACSQWINRTLKKPPRAIRRAVRSALPERVGE